jgi:hypothetical protein
MFQRDEEDKQNRLLVIQCDSGHLNGDLIACARYRVYDERVNALSKNKIQNRDGVTHVLFIVNLPHQVSSSTFVGFQGDPWISSHINDLRPTSTDTIEPLHAIATNISELFIGEYIHDIAPLLDATSEQLSRQPSQSNSEENVDEEEVTQEMPVHNASGDAKVLEDEEPESDDVGGHQVLPELQAVHDTGGETDLEDKGGKLEDDAGEYQVQPELQAVNKVADVEDETEDSIGEYQMQPDPKAGISSPGAESSSTEQVPEIPERPSVPESTASAPYLQQMLQGEEDEESSTNLAIAETSKVTEPSDTTAYQENPAHFESVGSDRDQAGHGLSPQTQDEPAGLPSVDEGVATTDIKLDGKFNQEIHQKSGKKKHPSGQCRRLYSCIQAAASRLEDSTKDRSTQRVTRLTKLIQRSPDHLGKIDFYLKFC